jgi:glutathione S-transferase
MAKVKLHRCSYTFLHVDADACWRMQKALDAKGVDYEIVKHGYGKSEKSRSEIVEMTGQKYVPVLELADGTIFREETDDMVAKLESGDLPGPLS